MTSEQVEMSEQEGGQADAAHLQWLRTTLVQIRRSQGLTQAAVAARMGVTQTRISDLERSTSVDVRLSSLQRYARALGVRLRAELVQEEGS